jgi:hypothetical protein
MHIAQLRHQLHLPWKKIIIFSAILSGMTTGQSWSQGLLRNKKNFYGVNQAEYENRRMHYGFFLAYHNYRYKMAHSNEFVTPRPGTNDEIILAITPSNNSGFGLGIIANYRFSRFFSIRALPAVAFYSREVQYLFQNPTSAEITTGTQTKESTNVELPILLKYQSERRDNVRMYLVAGLKGSIEANTKRKEGGTEGLNTSNMDLAVEYGAGFDLFYEFVKFSPELRFSHGLINVLDPNQNIYSRGISRLSTHTVSLYLHFE